MSVQIATRVSDELGARLRVLMEREQRSMGAILRLALMAYADRAVEQALEDAKPRTVSPAPAEQPRMLVRSEADAERELEDALSDAPRFRHSGPYDAAVSRREFRPYPKGGKP